MTRRQPLVRFSIAADLAGTVPEPVATARTAPPWWRRLRPRLDPVNGFPPSTVKGCGPFREAMMAGYVLGTVAACRVTFEDGRPRITWDSDTAPIVTDNGHPSEQVEGMPMRHDRAWKWFNPWFIQTPPGYSSLFVPPLNRGDQPFEVFSGVVETDVYTSQVQLPCRWTGPLEGEHWFDAGTPVVQVIPFRREPWRHEVEVADADRVAELQVPVRRARNTLNGYVQLFGERGRWR